MVVEWVYMTASYVTASCINREIKNLTGGDTEHRYKQNNQVWTKQTKYFVKFGSWLATSCSQKGVTPYTIITHLRMVHCVYLCSLAHRGMDCTNIELKS